MAIFFSYIFLGLSLAAPIGPVNAAQLDKGIKSGFLHSWLVGFGAMMADLIYMAAVFLGFVNFLAFPLVKVFLWTFGFFVLFYTGIESILSANKMISYKRQIADSAFNSFVSGFLLSLSNPLTIMFWLGIYGSVLAKTMEADRSHIFIYSTAIIIGLLIWDITMAFVASSFRRFLTGRILIVISILSGLSLIGFAIYFGYQALFLLFSF